MAYQNEIRDYLDFEIETLYKLDIDAMDKAIELILDVFEKGKTIYVFGNGGSSATASHFQNDFNKGMSEYVEKKFNFMCLNDNIATVMAIANDIGFEEVFRFQLAGRIEKDDIVIAISGSGNSLNVLNAVRYAKSRNNKVIGLTGFDGGALAKECDISLNIPVNNMQVTEDVHMICNHLMMSVIIKCLTRKVGSAVREWNSINKKVGNAL